MLKKTIRVSLAFTKGALAGILSRGNAIYAGLKDKEKTIEYLKKAYQDKSVWLLWLKVEDIFDFVRTDPRFQEIQRGVGPPN